MSTHNQTVSSVTMVAGGLFLLFGFIALLLFPPLGVVMILLGVGGLIYGARSRNATLGKSAIAKGTPVQPDYLDHLRDTYATPPQGWGLWPEAAVEDAHLGVLAILGVNRYILHRRPAAGGGPDMWFFPPNGWTNGTSAVGSHTSFFDLNATSTLRPRQMARGQEDGVRTEQSYVRHIGIHILNGRYAIPALRVTPEGTGLKSLATVTRADYDSASVDSNSMLTFSLGTPDHPALEPQLLQLIADNAERGYTYHIEGDLLIVMSLRPDADPRHLAAHIGEVAAAIPAYLYT